MPEHPEVLVTGATGFVGRHLLAALAGQPWRVRCLVRREGALDGMPGLRPYLGNVVTGVGLDDAVRGVDMVFHLAGVTKATRPGEYYDGNVQGTGNLLDALMRNGSPISRLVYVSSLAAVGPSLDGAPLTEDASPCPLTHYGRSKLKGEELVLSSPLADRAVIVRPPVVYGPCDTDVYEVLRAASRGLLVRIGRQEQYCSVVYVKDLAAALLAAARTGGIGGKTYFVASQERVSWTELAGMAAAHMGKRLRTVTVPPGVAWAAGWLSEVRSRLAGKPNIVSRDKVREAACRFWLCDASRARKELSLAAATPLARGLAETLEWYKDSGWLRF